MKAPATLFVTSTVHKSSGRVSFSADTDRAYVEWTASLKENEICTAYAPVVEYVHPDEVARLIAEAVAAARSAA